MTTLILDFLLKKEVIIAAVLLAAFVGWGELRASQARSALLQEQAEARLEAIRSRDELRDEVTEETDEELIDALTR